MPIDCFRCPKSLPSNSALISHLVDSHGSSRIEARKQLEKRVRGNDPDYGTPFDYGSKKDELVRELRRLDQQVSRQPSFHDITECGTLCYDDLIEEFGSLTGAFAFAGLIEFDPEEYDDNVDGNKKYSEWDLVSELYRVLELCGKISLRQFERAGRISPTTYDYRFGSWAKALERAGIEPIQKSKNVDRNGNIGHYVSSSWRNARKKALDRDGHECQECGMSQEEHINSYNTGLNVHHIIDIVEFEDPADADDLDNLQTLCVKCHGSHSPLID